MSVAAVRDDFAIRIGRFDNLPQTDGVVAELREQIALDGVLSPILVWTNGEIIDGHTRYRIAEELGMHRGIEFRIIECSEEEAYWKAYRLNTHRRQWTLDQRNAHIVWLRAKGWTQQRVAEATGLSQRQVSNIAPGDCIEVTAKQAKRIAGRHAASTPEESKHLNAAIRDCFSRGLSIGETSREVGLGRTAIIDRTRKYGLRDRSNPVPAQPSEEEEESEKFLKLNDQLAVDLMSKFKVGVQAGREEDCDINRVVMAQGLLISRERVDGAIQAVGTVQRVYRRADGATLGRTLRIIRDSFGDAGFQAPVIDGVGRLAARYNGQLDDQTLVKNLRTLSGGVTGLLQRAEITRRATGTQKGDAVAATLVEIANRGKRGSGRLPAWWADAS